MAARIYLNNVSTKLTAQLLVGGTTANVTAGDGALFAAATGGDWIIGTLRRMSGYKDVAREIVKITARSTDALTITRAQESTTALQFEIGDQLDVSATAASFGFTDLAGTLFGVTALDAWHSSYRVVGLGAASQFAMAAGSTSALGLIFSNGAYLDSGLAWKYGKTQAVSAHVQASGTHQFLVAASGTAGNAATMVTGLLIDNNGMNTPTSIARSVVTETGATRTVLATDNHIICNRAGTITLTLPSAATYLYREIYVRTITANTVVSNASNVVPLAGGAAGTAILAATAGKWALLVSNGTNWEIMASN